jgi:hypothetical protein
MLSGMITWELFLFCRAVRESNLQPADEESRFRGFGNFKSSPFLNQNGPFDA